MEQATTAGTNGEPARHAQRAAELLHTALGVLREEAGGAGMADVVDRVNRATARLERVNGSGADPLASVVDANRLLGDALQAARMKPDLNDRHAQALETVRRTVILLNQVTRDHGKAELPPPIPGQHARGSQSTPAGSERRASPRAFLETEVSFESANNFYTGFMEDISEGGLFLATYDLRPMGTEIEIEFSLPNGHIVRTTGIVRWMRDPRDEEPGAPPGMGLQFHRLAPEDQDAINQFIAARTPLFFED